MTIFSTVMNNPYMKWGAIPGAVGAAAGIGYGSYLNYADHTTYSMGTSAALGALAGLTLASPGGLTSRARRDYGMYAATARSLGYGEHTIGTTGFSRAIKNL